MSAVLINLAEGRRRLALARERDALLDLAAVLMESEIEPTEKLTAVFVRLAEIELRERAA